MQNVLNKSCIYYDHHYAVINNIFHDFACSLRILYKQGEFREKQLIVADNVTKERYVRPIANYSGSLKY